MISGGYIALPSMADFERLQRRIEALERIFVDHLKISPSLIEDWHGKAKGTE